METNSNKKTLRERITLDEIISDLACAIIRAESQNEISGERCNEEIMDIDLLVKSLDEFTNKEYARGFTTIKCLDITFEFLEKYRKFLELKKLYENKDRLVICHFTTLGKILYVASLYTHFDWDPELIKKYKKYSPFVL